MIKNHYFKQVTEFNNYSIKDLIVEYNAQYIINTCNNIRVLKMINAPLGIIQQRIEKVNKCYDRLVQNKADMNFTYRDGIDKNMFFNTRIFSMQLEYNSRDRVVACIVNNLYRINYNTRYCPIVNKILM